MTFSISLEQHLKFDTYLWENTKISLLMVEEFCILLWNPRFWEICKIFPSQPSNLKTVWRKPMLDWLTTSKNSGASISISREEKYSSFWAEMVGSLRDSSACSLPRSVHLLRFFNKEHNIFLSEDCLFVSVLEKGVGTILTRDAGITAVAPVKHKGNSTIETTGSEKK